MEREVTRAREGEIPIFPHEQPEYDTLLGASKRGKSTKVKTYFQGERTSFNNISSEAKKSI